MWGSMSNFLILAGAVYRLPGWLLQHRLQPDNYSPEYVPLIDVPSLFWSSNPTDYDGLEQFQPLIFRLD